MERLTGQAEWVARARAVMPAGGFGNFDPGLVIREGSGARVRDEDGREYVDFLTGSGPLVLGHRHPEVIEAVVEQLGRGQTFYANNAQGIALAEEIVRAVPCAEQVRFVSAGGEAFMFAVRVARAATGRSKILKFEGGYHGMAPEAQMSLAPKRLVNFPSPVPDSAGIPDGVAAEVLVAPFNDPAFLSSIMAERGAEIAAVVMEPFQRIIPPEPGFLETVRAECDKAGALLLFDEIVTGFRFAYGGAQEYYGVVPDICTLGKILGGGFPLAAFAGRAEVMACLDKALTGEDRWLMHSGTLSGNPVAAAAGLKTLEILRRDGQYPRLRANGEAVMRMAAEALAAEGVTHTILGDATLFDVVLAPGPIRDYRGVMRADAAATEAFNAALREAGVLRPPGKLYISLALTEADLALTETALRHAARAAAGVSARAPAA
ncbi:MAG: aspartate aminotransferase family protein [Paracoccaceae bacterium]